MKPAASRTSTRKASTKIGSPDLPAIWLGNQPRRACPELIERGRLKVAQDVVLGSLPLFGMFFVKLPQNRHPEAERFTDLSRDTALGGAESKDPEGAYLNPCWSELFNHRSPRTGSPAVRTGWSRVHHFITVIIFHLQVCAKSLNSVIEKLRAAWVKMSTLGVLRLRATKRCITR